LPIIFAYYLHLLSNGGSIDPNIAPPHAITGIPMLDRLIEGKYAYFASVFEHDILPSLALSIEKFGVMTRILRSSLLNVMQTNFTLTARAKGLDENTVFFKHPITVTR
jgi:peptide/nickel transport system permease protein